MDIKLKEAAMTNRNVMSQYFVAVSITIELVIQRVIYEERYSVLNLLCYLHDEQVHMKMGL